MSKPELSKKTSKQLETIGLYLKEIRFSEGMTREEVCQNTKMHVQTLMRIETQKKGYNIVHIFELADFFDLSPSEILSILD